MIRHKVFKRVVLIFTLLLLAVFLTYIAVLTYVDNRLSQRDKSHLLQQCFKVWSTRGLVADSTNRLNDANSIEAVSAALKAGAKGVEVDVFFDVELDRFIVSHDKPYNLKNGQLLTLSKLFLAIELPSYYWLDFKKLTRLNESEVKQAVNRLKLISKETVPFSQIYIESEHPLKLPPFQNEGFRTILDTQPLPESYYGTRFIHNLYKIVYYFGDFSVMGLGYGEISDPEYNQISEEVLKNVPLFIYHVPNEEALIQRLSNQRHVRVVLNENETVNMFGLKQKNCKD